MPNKRGNPNWGRPILPASIFCTGFEIQVKQLHLTREQYVFSARLRKWCEENRNRDYAIYGNIRAQLDSGIRVVVFDRDRQLQAEGVVSALTPQPSQRVRRYHVHIPNLKQVPYTTPRVNRCGVAFV
jgi:hypothetical protein